MKQIIKKIQDPVVRRLDALYAQGQINMAMSRAGASFPNRNIDLKNPNSWEASGFSQNGEDGMIDMLLSKVRFPNRYFLEIGSGNGLENNSSYLAHVRKYGGMQIEGNPHEHEEALKNKAWYVDCRNMFVSRDRVADLLSILPMQDPDFFSLDIDGMDYHVASSMLERGFRPKVAAVEFNSAFGPSRQATVAYNENFNMFKSPNPYLYYGASVAAWKKLFGSYGYVFVAVESNGVNAFFAEVNAFHAEFLAGLQGYSFRENIHQLRKFNTGWEGQYEMMKDLGFEEL